MPRILIVEDERAIADSLEYAFARERMETRLTGLGEEALALLARESFDLVLLDVGLPDVSGFELCQRLRTFSRVPVIFLTARGDEVDRIVGLEIGADDYVVKPFSPREVVARIRTVLRRAAAPDVRIGARILVGFFLLLLVVLGAAMVLTRRLDWYVFGEQLGARRAQRPPEAPGA